MKVLINDRNRCLARLGMIFSLAILTFVIPLLQWLTEKLVSPTGYSVLMGNVLIILVFGYWSVRNHLFDYSSSLPVGRAVLYLMGVSVLVLLILNMQSRPASGITGQARSPYEVIDVIILGSVAEELVFRGAMWSFFQQLAKGVHENMTALVGTSILFGVGHLGYWVQSNWPLPIEAYVHSSSMILAGVFFGIFRLKTRSLTIPMFIHMLANGIILVSQ